MAVMHLHLNGVEASSNTIQNKDFNQNLLFLSTELNDSWRHSYLTLVFWR